MVPPFLNESTTSKWVCQCFLLLSTQDGIDTKLRLHKVKSNAELPPVQRVLGILRGFQPESMLAVGSARGTFLWPLLAAFPDVRITAVDLSKRRAADLAAVSAGGIERLQVVHMDVQCRSLSPRSIDVATALEVLGHLPEPQSGLTHPNAIARRSCC